jgi:ABC-2 type transport system permease protein
MKSSRAWTLATKEMAEFRTNRYILFTLFLPPILFAVILPVAMFVPLQAAAGTPLDLDLPLSDRWEGATIDGAVLQGAAIEASQVTRSYVNASYVGNSTVRESVLRNSYLRNVTLVNSVVIASNLEDVRVSNDTQVMDSAYVGGAAPRLLDAVRLLISLLALFYLIVPVVVPTVLASYSFVGEKVNRSLEPLLATPASDGELLLGKSLSIFLPTMGATWISFAVGAVLVDVLTFPLLGSYPIPDMEWLLILFLLAPLVCVLAIATNVLISSRVSDVRASQQLGAIVVAPVLILVFSSVAGLLALGPGVILAFAGLLAAVDAGVVALGLKTFRREEILVRWK